MRLQNQIAVVTGAGRNIGEDVCKLFVREGAKVAVVDLDREEATALLTRLMRRSRALLYRSCATSRQPLRSSNGSECSETIWRHRHLGQ